MKGTSGTRNWEVDWDHPGNNGSKVLARNPTSRFPKSREWHLVSTGYLREQGIEMQTYSKSSWEVEWSRRKGVGRGKSGFVWARNLGSKMPTAREWHWVDMTTLSRAGISWQPTKKRVGWWVTSSGYIDMSPLGMTPDEIKLAEENKLFVGSGNGRRVSQHRLVAAKKYGCLPKGMVVRHINGNKQDNRPENLILGTNEENQMDHGTARLMAMYWRERCERAESELSALRNNTIRR